MRKTPYAHASRRTKSTCCSMQTAKHGMPTFDRFGFDFRPEADTPSAVGVSHRLVELGKLSPAGDTLSASVPASGPLTCH